MDKANTEIVSAINPEVGQILWQPVMMVPVNSPDHQRNYPGMKVIAIRMFSAVCIILGIASIGVQIAALVIYATSLFNCVVSKMDVVGHGIWAGALYLTAGSLGIAASHKRTQSLMVGTVVLAILSICASVIASTLSGIAAAHGVYISCYYQSSYFSSLCDAWLYLEWTLMSISVLAFFSSLTLIFLMSLGIFSKRKSSTNAPLMRFPQEAEGLRPDSKVNQPIYLKPQSISKTTSQQYFRPAKSNLQVVYVAQENHQQQLQTLQLVPVSVPTHQSRQQQESPVNETNTNFQLQLKKKLAAKESKLTKSNVAQAPK